MTVLAAKGFGETILINDDYVIDENTKKRSDMHLTKGRRGFSQAIAQKNTGNDINNEKELKIYPSAKNAQVSPITYFKARKIDLWRWLR